MIRKAVIPAAGLGTRNLPATKIIPKEMLCLVDRPLIQNAIEEAKAAGIEEFILVTSSGKEMQAAQFQPHAHLYATLQARGKETILNALKAADIPSGKLHVVYQDSPRGLGHAVGCAAAAVGNEPFAVLLPDDVVLAETGCLTQMVKAYEKLGGNMMAVVDVPRAETSRYGILEISNDDGKVAVVTGLVEKPKPEEAPSTLSIIGRYILQPEIFAELARNELGAGGEIQLTDAMARLIGRQPFHGFRYDGKRYDCGHAVGLIEANVAYALANPALAAELKPLLHTLLKG